MTRNVTVEFGFLEHLKKGKDDAKAEVEAYRASFLEALQHIENAILASHGTALPLRVVRKYLNRYEMESN